MEQLQEIYNEHIFSVNNNKLIYSNTNNIVNDVKM